MLDIQENFSLKDFNTFGIDVFTDFFVEIKDLKDLKFSLKFAEEKKIKILFLGGGSNILLTQNFKGLVIKNSILGKEILRNEDLSLKVNRGREILDNDFVFVKCNGGEVWDDFVEWTLGEKLFGLENLSLIPGQVGTCPIQNIGAYGVEVKDNILEVEVLDLKTQEIKFLKNSDCLFGYRDSHFKRNKQKYFIISVTFKLLKKFIPNLKYKILLKKLTEKNILENITGRDVRDVVIEIRESKLPDPKKIGNAGSFFKNPIVEKNILENIQKNFKDVPNFEVEENLYKIPAGWLIEQTGLKGKIFGNVGIHKKQALVLVNYGGGLGEDILNLAKKIQQEVFEKFGIDLKMEVNIL